MREALLAHVREEADRDERQAADRVAAHVAQAEEQVAALIRRAHSEGEAAAEREAAAELAHARRRARALVLAAQRSVYDDVRREAHAGAQQLRSEPCYAALVERLAALARERLGPEAELQLDPPEGGVVARRDNRRIDYTLPRLVDRCLAEHAAELERLWR